MNRIKFRKLSTKDIDDLFQIYSDKEAMKYRGSKPMENTDDAKAFVRNQELVQDNTLTIRKGIVWLEKEQLIGTVMYRFDEDKKGVCEIGYSIGRSYWGQGFGNETVKLLLETIKEDANIKQIIAWSHKENIASIKILEKNEFDFIKEDEDLIHCLFQKVNYR